MASASDTLRRAFVSAPAGFRPIVLVALCSPLFLSACATNQAGTTTAALKPSVSAPDAYGYAPVRISAFTDGSRIALPSHKPDAAKLAADPASAKGPAVRPLAKPAAGVTYEISALQADVAERKATTAGVVPAAAAPASDAVAIKSARLVAAPRPDRGVLATAADATVAVAGATAKAVPATIAAVADTAVAVKVATVETTAKAYDAVSDRISDTFGGKDTITGSAAIDRMIEQSAAENGIPSELAYAVVRVESHYNPKAKGSGVYGLSQIQPSTARSLGFSGPTNALYDPETNLRYGMKYLAGAWQKSGHDVCGTAMKYKGGHRTTTMSKSAAAYCANVKRHMAAIERRRGPLNRETIVAANQRTRQIAVASAAPAAAPVVAAASSASGRMVAASAIPAPRAAALGTSLVASSDAGRSGRVLAASTPIAASTTALGLAD